MDTSQRLVGCSGDPVTGCVFSPISGDCNADDSECTTGDSCIAGVCTPGAVTQCPVDDNPCTLDSCDPKTGVCLNSGEAMDGKFCDVDGDLCMFEM